MLKDELILFTFNVSLAQFIRILWVIILYVYRSLTHEVHCGLNHVMHVNAEIAGLIQFVLLWCKSPTLPLEPSPHFKRAFPMLFRSFSLIILFDAKFRALIRHSKGLYFTSLWFSIWSTGVF